ncbi:hypothetical protein GWO55_09375 [Corynebacterium macginleyi]|uniref:hypothetical protein n=1 Tax=Corynebacterium macginleyi TaxID=38290 RepID=UPI00190B0E47|nr:hypothetical protein [Corynebacterium macginleyi]MBK4166311.1 hypothetical protein [Corynebacterium macginleyi]
MARRRIKKAKAYSMHGFITPEDGGALKEYSNLIKKLGEKYGEIKLAIQDEVIAIVGVYRAHGLIAFQFIAGTEDTITIYDQISGKAINEKLPDGQLSAAVSWLICDPHSRIAFIESRRPGVSREKMRKLIKEFGRKELNYPEFEFEFHPLAGLEFHTEVNRFTRIREVDVILSRPNKDWLPASLLAGAAADSNAYTVEIETKAARGKSLSKDRGIIDAVTSYARKRITALKEVRIKGTVPDVEGEYVAKLSENQATVSTRIEADSTESEIAGALMQNIDKTRMKYSNGEMEE